MNLFYVKYRERQYQFAITDVAYNDGFEIVFIKNILPGQWIYDGNKNTIKRIDIESTEEYEVFSKQIGNAFTEETLIDKMKLILDSQIFINSNKEHWTAVKYDITDTEDGGTMVNIISHRVAFHFGQNGELKGINSWNC